MPRDAQAGFVCSAVQAGLKNMDGVISDILNQHPLLVVFDILAIVAAIGSILVLTRETVTFRGYRNIQSLVKSIARALDAKVFRDGADLVISGFHRGMPAVIRFSFAENTPEVHLWLKVSSALNLFVTHKSLKSAEGRMRIPTRDSWFDDRFVIRTDNPNDAVALLTDDRAFAELKKLCCSPNTAVALSKESLEMSEQTIPQPNPYQHLLAHLDSLAEIAVRVGAISNQRKSKSQIYVPDRYVVARVALVLLAIAGGVEVISAVMHYGKTDTLEVSKPVAESGLSDQELVNLPSSADWRLATSDDFDASTVAWAKDHGDQVGSRFMAMFNGAGHAAGTGYVLLNKDASQPDPWRIAMLSQGRDIFDARFSNVLAVVPVKKDSLTNITWKDPGSQYPPDGDGWMVIRHSDDGPVAAVFYLSSGKVASRVPVDYTQVDLR